MTTATATISPADLTEQYSKKIRKIASRVVGWQDSEDVLQDVLLLICSRLHQFNGESDIGTWIYRISINAALNFRRKRALRKMDALPDVLLDYRSAPIENDNVAVVRQAIEKLPDTYRAPIILDLTGASHRDIAESLGLSAANLKNRLHRAKILLREILLADAA